MNANARMYRSRPSRAIEGCPQADGREIRLCDIVQPANVRHLPVPAANDDRPTPPAPASAQQAAA